jgi:hypothetical protein
MESVIEALFSYLTPVTILVAMFVPSLWVAGAAGVAVAMIGVLAFTTGQPNSSIVAGWMISQVAVALITNLIRRKTR